MTKKQLRELPLGTALHAERPGQCRLLVVREHRPGCTILDGGPVRFWGIGDGTDAVLLHLPEACPVGAAEKGA